MFRSLSNFSLPLDILGSFDFSLKMLASSNPLKTMMRVKLAARSAATCARTLVLLVYELGGGGPQLGVVGDRVN